MKNYYCQICSRASFCSREHVEIYGCLYADRIKPNPNAANLNTEHLNLKL